MFLYVGLAFAIWLIRMAKPLIASAISLIRHLYQIIKCYVAKLLFLLTLHVAHCPMHTQHPIVSTFVQIVSTWMNRMTSFLHAQVVKVNLICGHLFHRVIFILNHIETFQHICLGMGKILFNFTTLFCKCNHKNVSTINVGRYKTLSIAKSYLWSFVWFDNFNFVSAIAKMFQQINVGIGKTSSFAKSLLWSMFNLTI